MYSVDRDLLSVLIAALLCFQKCGGTDESCSSGRECRNGQYCIRGKCLCLDGQVLINNRCVQSLDCRNEQKVNGRCRKMRAPGMTCFANDQCPDKSKCLNGYCRCSNETELNSSYCIRLSGTEKCDVHQTYIDGKCLDLAIPGEDCVHSLQCIAASICDTGKCVCSNGYTQVKKYCVEDQQLSTKCNKSQVLINSQCYEFAKIGEYCIDAAVCLGNSICCKNSCTCPRGTVAENGQCRRKKPCIENEIEINGQCYVKANIGQQCQFAQQCTSISTCQNGICICPPGTVSQNNNCVPSGICPTGQVYIAESCWDIAYIGQQCKFTQQCQGYSTCENSMCRCPNDTAVRAGLCTKEQCNKNEIVIDRACFQKVKIDDFCYYTQQCQGNATCKTNRCLCPSGSMKSNDTCVINSKCQPYQVSLNGSCLDAVSIGMACQDNAQCIGAASCVPATSTSDYNIRTCQCTSGTIFTGTECLPSSLQCPTSTAYIGNKGCYALVEIGQFCMYTAQCLGYSLCSGQICKCPGGYEVIRNACRII